jgi:hypothetical protein
LNLGDGLHGLGFRKVRKDGLGDLFSVPGKTEVSDQDIGHEAIFP